jgi:signal transduction histidine kinase
MSDVQPGSVRRRLREVTAFARASEPRKAVSWQSLVVDTVLALVVMLIALIHLRFFYPWAAIVTALPLAARRRYPLGTFFVVLAASLAVRKYATDMTFVAIVFAAYSAVVHSRYRGAALLSLVPAAGLIGVVFWNAPSAIHDGLGGHAGAVIAGRLNSPPHPPGSPGIISSALVSGAPWRLAVLLVLVSLISIATVGTAVHLGNRIRSLQADHEVATRRALELERSRIASEMHDLVTHNVSMMIVQAGAARQVLASSPDDARDALLAVESSGRTAMTELRQLLGLLSPVDANDGPGSSPPGADMPRRTVPGSGSPVADRALGSQGHAADSAGAPGSAAAVLRPQPGLGQVQGLIERVRATGVPVELDAEELPEGLPPGLDLAAFRVVQEALTNVVKHAGKPRTTVTLGLDQGVLVVEVSDEGAPIPAAVPAMPAGGRGLIGLRERVALFGGELDAGPGTSGGWRVQARIPVNDSIEAEQATAAVER